MRGTKGLLGLLPLSMVVVMACDSEDPLAVAAAERVPVRIIGPSVIEDSGVYTWEAETDGLGGDIEFVWEVVRSGGDGETTLLATGRVLTLNVDRDAGSLSIRLTARSDGRTYAASHAVSTCSNDPPFHDTRIIDECSLY